MLTVIQGLLLLLFLLLSCLETLISDKGHPVLAAVCKTKKTGLSQRIYTLGSQEAKGGQERSDKSGG